VNRITNTDKVLAARSARDMLAYNDAIIWDTETTGLRDPFIVTIAAINLKGETLLDLIMDPEAPIESGASSVHGIFNKDVIGRRPFREHIINIWDVLRRGPWIVYNLDYDRPILQRQMASTPLGLKTYADPFHERKVKKMSDCCAMECFAQFYGEWNDYRNSYTWKKLTVACDYLGITGIDDPPHSAIGDCRRTLAVLQAMDAWLTKHEKAV